MDLLVASQNGETERVRNLLQFKADANFQNALEVFLKVLGYFSTSHKVGFGVNRSQIELPCTGQRGMPMWKSFGFWWRGKQTLMHKQRFD
jgi:hypothetical protein